MKEIKELYKEYINLKNASLSYEDLELQLYYKLIHFNKIESDELDCNGIHEKIDSALWNSTMNSKENYKKGRTDYISKSKALSIKETSEFLYVSYFDKQEKENNYIKFYLSVPKASRENFMSEFGEFLIKNNIKGNYKIRKNSKANDEVTIRIYNPNDYKQVLNCIKLYSDCNTKQHFLMPTIGDIGVIIDDGNSYNKFIVDNLISYFENYGSENEINIDSFINYISSKDVINRMNCENRWSSIIYRINISNSQSKDFKLEELIGLIKKSQEAIEKFPLPQRRIMELNRSLYNSLDITSSQGLEKGIEYLNKIINSPLFYPTNTVKALETCLDKRMDYDKQKGVFEYLKEQLIILDENIEKICRLIDESYQYGGISKIEKIINNLKKIIEDQVDGYNLNIKEVNIPNINNDELHPTGDVSTITLNRIYQRLKLIHHIKDNDEHLCDFAEKILSIYGKKPRIKRKKV